MYLHHKDKRHFLSIEIGYVFLEDFYKQNSKALESLNFGFSLETLIFHATMHDSDILIYRLKIYLLLFQNIIEHICPSEIKTKIIKDSPVYRIYHPCFLFPTNFSMTVDVTPTKISLMQVSASVADKPLVGSSQKKTSRGW